MQLSNIFIKKERRGGEKESYFTHPAGPGATLCFILGGLGE